MRLEPIKLHSSLQFFPGGDDHMSAAQARRFSQQGGALASKLRV